jgi:arsenite methyltransferase
MRKTNVENEKSSDLAELASARNGSNESFDLDVESSVKARYGRGAQEREDALCCPVSYDPKYLEAIPKEVIERDYGCGDPSQYIRRGETVLDLGSGAGKICYIASQVVGPEGKVIGVDFNPAMLELSRKYTKEAAETIGWANVEFRRGRIQDLKTDLDAVDRLLAKQTISDADAYLSAQTEIGKLGESKPLIESDSIDVIVSNCVLNLVRPSEKHQLFDEMHRVLKTGGRVAISDIVSDEEVPQKLQTNTELWSGCISGAFQEKAFLKAFEEAGFYGIKIEKRDETPWRTVEGIEFRSMTVTAFKGKEGECWERNQAVIYKGPWKQVVDDDHHVLRRGVRTAVCEKTFNIMSKAPYGEHMVLIKPRREIPLEKAKPFDCGRSTERHSRESKGEAYKQTDKEASSCLDGGCC